MATVKMMFSPANSQRFMTTSEMIPEIRADLAAGKFTSSEPFEVEGEGVDAADEAFDLTNNPGRQEEREEKYGRGRSLSSGDIVEVNGTEHWVCLSFGWDKL